MPLNLQPRRSVGVRARSLAKFRFPRSAEKFVILYLPLSVYSAGEITHISSLLHSAFRAVTTNQMKRNELIVRVRYIILLKKEFSAPQVCETSVTRKDNCDPSLFGPKSCHPSLGVYSTSFCDKGNLFTGLGVSYLNITNAKRFFSICMFP